MIPAKIMSGGTRRMRIPLRKASIPAFFAAAALV
jgi:hypothetical protein